MKEQENNNNESSSAELNQAGAPEFAQIAVHVAKRKPKLVKLRHLGVGRVFKFEDKLYLSVDYVNNDSYALLLESFSLRHVGADSLVQPLYNSVILAED
jgi:hypothetical protein